VVAELAYHRVSSSVVMHIVLVGVNHRSCPIELREQFAFGAEQVPHALTALRQECGAAEAAILSTCNRVEIYAAVPSLDGSVDRLSAFLGRRGARQGVDFSLNFYRYQEPDSVRHLFTVASGLDSMVLGETEILQQVKRAYEVAREEGATGKIFNVLFQKALNTGKTVHTKTSLGRGCVSVGTVALELAQKIFGELRPYTVLLVGAGKIGEVTLKRLVDRGVSRIRIANRSLERARELAGLYGGAASGLESLTQELLQADIVITSAAAPQALITKTDIQAVMPQRHHRPLCVIDLGVPRNADASIGQLENVYLFDIDDLQGLVSHHHQQRQQAVLESQAIVEHKVQHFVGWWQKEFVNCAPSSSELAAAP